MNDRSLRCGGSECPQGDLGLKGDLTASMLPGKLGSTVALEVSILSTEEGSRSSE